MTGPDLQRWSRDVAEDPGSPSFVPLARAYRRQGRREAALNVTLRGLERNPEHLEGHALLALIHVDAGDRERAGDEWEIMLRLDPDNFDARRGLGFLALERGDLSQARKHLQAAAAARPGDPAVAQAVEVLKRREGERPSTPRATPAPAGPEDPARLFEPLSREAPFLGALLLDDRGLVLAGGFDPGSPGDGEALGALLSPAIDEARRAVTLLDLGDWGGLLLDCEGASLHVAPANGGVLVVAARTDTATGWVVRTAGRAQELARRFIERQS